MESTTAIDILTNLDESIEDLVPAIDPIIKENIADNAKKLPVIDKAKLYVLTAYIIESLIFSCLKLNNKDTKSHRIMSELTRVRKYMAKIKDTETGVQKRENMSLDKEAAGRIIKAGLAGNDKWDAQQAEMRAGERVAAHAKATDLSERIRVEEDAQQERRDKRRDKRKRKKAAKLERQEAGQKEDGKIVVTLEDDDISDVVEGREPLRIKDITAVKYKKDDKAAAEEKQDSPGKRKGTFGERDRARKRQALEKGEGAEIIHLLEDLAA